MIFHRSVLCITLYFVVLQLCSTTYAGCICKEKGIDYCEACNEPLIVRPKQKLYDSAPELDLPPIGDNCWCSKLTIEPASLPKPKKVPCGCKVKSSYGDPYLAPSYPLPSIPYVHAKPKDYSLPADPISVSLAVQAGKAIEVPEAKVAYGFIQKPVDDIKKIIVANIPEENLYKLKNEVITLKKRPLIVHKPEEEDLVDIEEEEEGYIDDEQPHLTYKQLGYVAEKFKNPKFRKIAPTYAVNYDTNGYKPDKVYVDCGFKPGKVSYYKKGNKYDAPDCYEHS